MIITNTLKWLRRLFNLYTAQEVEELFAELEESLKKKVDAGAIDAHVDNLIKEEMQAGLSNLRKR